MGLEGDLEWKGGEGSTWHSLGTWEMSAPVVCVGGSGVCVGVGGPDLPPLSLESPSALGIL